MGYNTREFESIKVGYGLGRSFDSVLQLWTVEAAYKFTEQFAAEYELEYLTLDPDPEGESTWIHVVRADQFFTPDLFLRLFFQTNSSIDRNNIQVTFVYRHTPPFGTIQLAFQRGTAEFGKESTQGNTLFLKGTWVFLGGGWWNQQKLLADRSRPINFGVLRTFSPPRSAVVPVDPATLVAPPMLLGFQE